MACDARCFSQEEKRNQEVGKSKLIENQMCKAPEALDLERIKRE